MNRDLPGITEEELWLRQFVWINHICNNDNTSHLYGDDGELQCSKCFIDFRREPILVIRDKLFELEILEISNYYKKQNE